MKIAISVILSCLCVCFVSCVTVTNWGNVNGRILGTENFNIGSSFGRVKTHAFTYPKGPSAYPIYGIKHLDYKSHPVEVQFLKGDIGHSNITIQLKSQRNHGINSTFIFYTL